ncbi:Htaa protein [Streptomyces sp. cf386]|uniref:HtaA domain-containing protein n=1 Tax=Streptomyces sp. cf386 TaxID=1761904 RepID=UPI00088FF94A|nr:HtaA domain-containing protein [Streptomyces sp. cf386]SDN26971.1 Htaa protein [Streptomyces sp. cf386]
MAKRPGAAAVTGGALLVLLCPGGAAAQDGDEIPRDMSGGYASWNIAPAELDDQGISLDVAEPAVQASADRAWFPTTSGSTDPETGAADFELGGSALLTSPTGTQPLPLSGLRLRLDGDAGALYARTVVDGRARQLALADVKSGAAPVVQTSGDTWTGLRASLTQDGAALLSEWSGAEFTAGDAYGVLDLTVGTGGDTTEAAPQETPLPTPGTPEEKPAATPQPATTAPSATVTLSPGAEQQVTGAGFEPGEVVLVAIDDDTRYQAVADEAGRISRTFPVYGTAAEGAHSVELSTVTGERRAVVGFGVRARA